MSRLEEPPARPPEPNAAGPRWYRRALSAVLTLLLGAGKAVAFVLVTLLIVSLPSAGLRWSSEHLPRPLHVVVLVATGLLLIWGLYWISTEDLRTRSYSVITEWFGGLAGPVILSTLLLVTAARVLASFTFILYDNGLVELTSNIAGEAVTEGRIWDFYLWHFLDVVPLLSIPDVMNLRVPVTYSGTWVGLLVLSFQALAVLILIPTVGWFIKYRRAHQPAPSSGTTGMVD
jgi:hypothetical protein